MSEAAIGALAVAARPIEPAPGICLQPEVGVS